MKTFIWCLRRELWEHWGLLVGLPIAAGLIATISIVIPFYTQYREAIILLAAAPAEMRTEFTLALITSKFMPLLVVPIALGLTILFYGSSTLYDDRRDGSNFFWKSLPISDAKMVGAKAAIVLIIAPFSSFICAVGAIAVSLLAAGQVAAFYGLNAFTALLSSATLYLLIAKTLALWPMFVLTTLPALGWMFAISALVKKRPLIWIIGLPLILALPISFIKSFAARSTNFSWVSDDIGARLLMGVTPGGWTLIRPSLSADTSTAPANAPGVAEVILQGWKISGLTDYWIAAAIGGILVFLAIRLRRWRVST